MDNNCVKYYPNPSYLWKVMAQKKKLLCELWHWPLQWPLVIKIQHCSEELRPRHHFWVCMLCNLELGYMTLGHGSWTTIVWNIIQIQHISKRLWPGHRFWLCVHTDLDLGDMTLGQGHDTPLGHGKQLCEISDKRVGSYGPDTMWTDRVIPIYPPKLIVCE